MERWVREMVESLDKLLRRIVKGKWVGSWSGVTRQAQGEGFGKETCQKCHFRARRGFKILPGNDAKML
jgi:hypothetical protein